MDQAAAGLGEGEAERGDRAAEDEMAAPKTGTPIRFTHAEQTRENRSGLPRM
jgi:hypothetical protein